MNEFTPLAKSMHDLYLALWDSGFNTNQSFELTKEYCSVAFMNEFLRLKYEKNTRSKEEVVEQFRKHIANMREEKPE